MAGFDEHHEYRTTVAGFPLQITTVVRDFANTGNAQVYVEWRVECADSATTFVAGRSYESHNEAERAAEDMLEVVRHFAKAIRGGEPPAVD